MTSCQICRGEIPEPDQNPQACPHCGAVAIVVGSGLDGVDWAGARPRAIAAYYDEAFPERNCDYCGKPYRGHAVYCSLECALEDA